MKQIKKIAALSTGLLALPLVSFAQFKPDGGAFGDLLNNILIFSNNVLIPFIIGIGFLVFVFGMFQFFIAGGANDEKKEQGKSLMIYATLGFVLIIVFWGIINLLTSSTGLDDDTLENLPTVNVITDPD
jgi:uncharacterized membrane protein YidH (DUF202 family)